MKGHSRPRDGPSALSLSLPSHSIPFAVRFLGKGGSANLWFSNPVNGNELFTLALSLFPSHPRSDLGDNRPEGKTVCPRGGGGQAPRACATEGGEESERDYSAEKGGGPTLSMVP